MKNYEGQDFKTLTAEGMTVVDFYATWCGPCKMLMPQLEDLSKERADVSFVKVDIDQHRALAKDVFSIASVPTLILFKDGVEVSRRSGFAPKADVSKWIDQYK